MADESTTPDGFLFPAIDLNASKCAACHVIFIIDACYSGETMVDMAVHSPPHAGQKLSVLVSSSSAETSLLRMVGGASRCPIAARL